MSLKFFRGKNIKKKKTTKTKGIQIKNKTKEIKIENLFAGKK